MVNVMSIDGGGGIPTLSTCVCLQESFLRARFLEFWSQPCQLGEHLVDDSYFRGKIVRMDMEGQKAANVSCEASCESASQPQCVVHGGLTKTTDDQHGWFLSKGSPLSSTLAVRHTERAALCDHLLTTQCQDRRATKGRATGTRVGYAVAKFRCRTAPEPASRQSGGSQRGGSTVFDRELLKWKLFVESQ